MSQNTVTIRFNLAYALIAAGLLTGAFIGLLFGFTVETNYVLANYGLRHYLYFFFQRLPEFLEMSNNLAGVFGCIVIGAGIGAAFGRIIAGARRAAKEA